MATETKPKGLEAVYGEQLALSDAVSAISVMSSRDGVALTGAVLYCTSDFRYQLTPVLRAALATANNGATYTDATAALRDRASGTVLTLNSLDTLAEGDFVLIGSDKPFGGIRVSVGNANSNASTLAAYYWNGTAWASASPTDGTASGGATLAQDGNVTWTTPATWAKTSINGNDLYWVRLTVSAALDSSVTVTGVTLLSKDAYRGYGYASKPKLVPISPALVGGIEALVSSGTPNLDITWCFGNLIAV